MVNFIFNLHSCDAPQEDVQEFHPYVFQIFAQLIELRSGPLPGIYMQIFPPLLSPHFWERPGNVPPLVRLLQVCLPKTAGDNAAACNCAPAAHWVAEPSTASC